MKWILLIATTVFTVACQQGGGDGGAAPSSPVTTPLNQSCINGNAYCNNQPYGQYSGWMPYPGMYPYAYNYSNQFQNGYCDCPYGSQPVYNGTYGLGCVNSQLLSPYSGYYQTYNTSWQVSWGYSYGYGYSSPQTETNFPQYSNIPGSTGGSCWQTITQSCILSEPNRCSMGATCRPVTGNSNLGVCALNK